MLSRILPAPIIGALSLLLHTLNTFFWFVPILLLALVKGMIRFRRVTRWSNHWLNVCASGWIAVNDVIHSLTKRIDWHIEIPQALSRKHWYLVIANHQSWVDIFALQKAFNRKIPFLKFFLKQQLIWVPVLGVAWWALDFPFMRRYSKSYLKKYPHKKGKDFETTAKACQKFKYIPISIMNFVEGTRFTQEKHRLQQSPFNHLLKPKSGGIGYVLTLMGNEIRELVDVTICYPDNGDFTFWDFLCGRVKNIVVQAELKAIPDDIRGDYINDAETRKKVQAWINQIWLEKDKKIAELQQKYQSH